MTHCFSFFSVRVRVCACAFVWVSCGLKLTEKLKVPDITSFKLGLFRQLLLKRLECSVEILELAFSTYI